MNKKQAGFLGSQKSKITLQKQKQQRIKEYNENPTICKQCGKILCYEQRHKKFCNSSCAASYSNKRRYLKSIKDRGTCLNCNKPLQKSQKKFCSNACQAQFKNKQIIDAWKQGKHSGTITNGQVSRFIKQYLLEKHNYKCELCGWGKTNPFTGKIPLELHHKDGNWQNNNEDNLIILCPNCHSLTSTYKASNKGNGRPYRRTH